ncbi:putative disease resistance protein RGA4 [Carex rostrata]
MDPLSIAAIGWLMSTLLNKDVTALLEAWAKRIGLGNEFKTLNDQLLQLSALLTSARGLRTNNRFLEKLVENLQQLAYRAENLLDELDYYRLEDEVHQTGTQESVNYSSKSSVASSSSSSFQLASRSILSNVKGMSFHSARDVLVALPKIFSSRINLSRRMNELAEQLQKSEEEVRKALKREALVITAQNTEVSQTEGTNLRQTSSFLIEPIVFGRDQERDQLMNLLTNEESTIVGKVPVLAIVGSGGVGKTTLARLVFNDPKVQSYFEIRLWICVSTRFDIDRLTRDMLECACGNRYDELTILDTLQNKLKDELVSRRFLLVLDDMWEEHDESQWHLMVAPLNCCMVKGSIILVTTRNKSVAKMVNARDIYLQGLDKDAFLSFFSTCIFNDPNFGGNQRLRNIGQRIANKLKGNPLAAKTVSALLKKNLDVRYWIEIKDSEEWKSQSGPNDIMPALRLSYEQMPFHLQRCFSYCAIFPEDHPFTCKRLIYLWMAQGFLDVRSEGKRIEDIGRAYFNDMFDRGFFQTIQSRYGDKVHYTFHDLIHDLAHIVAFKESLTINGPKPRQISPTIRHLSMFHGMKRAEVEDAIVRALSFLEGENLSTIISWDAFTSSIFQNNSDLLKKTKFLRAVRLNLQSWVEQHNFVSLRYLILLIPNFNTCKTLPTEICRLYHLQVLEIANGQLLNELPNNFSDLVSLRHFIVKGNNIHSKIRHVGKLTSLQKLKQFDVQQKIGFEIEQLGSLKDIRGSLHIRNLENVKSMAEASKARLAEKEKLDALYLNWKYGEQENENVLEGLKPNTNLKLLEINGYGGVASPTWLEPSLMFLESLTLMNCKAWDLLPPIGELEFLKYLKLSGLAVREIGPKCYGTHQGMKFPSLEELDINLPYLEKWVWNDQIQLFPCLKILKINKCKKLLDFPLSGCVKSEVLERFPSLERLVIFECPLILRPPPLPCSSLLSFISIENLANIESMVYERTRQKLSLMLDQSSNLKVSELLLFNELTSLRTLVISNISSLESLDLHYCVALENLVIKGCQSLTSLTFGEHLVSLKILKIISCKTLSSMKGLKSWINLERLLFRECPGFVAAWESELKEIERTEPEFSLSLGTIVGDSLALLTLPICKHLSSLQYFRLEVSTFTEEHEVSWQLLTSIYLVDIRGCKNLLSFPFDLFPSLESMCISFPCIQSLPASSQTVITEECLKLRNINGIYICESPVKIFLATSRRTDAVETYARFD